MKRAQMRADSKNILAVVVEVISGYPIYTIFYTSGAKRKFNYPSREFRSRFDWWAIRLSTSDSSIRVLTHRLRSEIPDSVFTYFPILKECQK